MSEDKNRPLVTGISPKEGFPGTKVTIRGERLGKSPSDLIGLLICGVDCHLTAEWFSPNKIVAKTLLCKGHGDIIVTTTSGGIGTSTVQFKGMQEAVIGPHKESAVWVEETISVGPRALSMAAYTQEDPLQLSSEANENKYPSEELAELFPTSSSNLRSDSFDPAYFLLENHHGTSFEDLKCGLKFLDRKVKSQTEGKLSFLKENIGSVLEQLGALVEVGEKWEKDTKKRDKGYLEQIDESIVLCEREAAKLFSEVLARKDRADETRNALNAFQRFRFIFSLPGTMEKNILKGDYDSALNDYIRAKSIFNSPEIDRPVFKKFEAEILVRVSNLKKILKNKLIEKPPNALEQRRWISHLVTLESDFDPAWLAIQTHYEFLSNSMRNCFNTYANFDKSGTNKGSKIESQTSSPCEVQFVEVLSDVFSTYFPDFWHLCLDYFNGKLPVKCEFGRQAQVKEMMTSVVELYGTLITSSLLPPLELKIYREANNSSKNDEVWEWRGVLDDKNEIVEWFPICVSYVRDSFTDFLTLDPPGPMLVIFKNLIFTLRSYSLDLMIHQMSVEISELYKEENWGSEPCGEHGFITQLPSKYETHVINSSKLLKETLLQKYSDEIPLLKSPQVRERLSSNLGNALASFADVKNASG